MHGLHLEAEFDMRNIKDLTTIQEQALEQQGLLNTPSDILANLASNAKGMGIDIRFKGEKSIVINRWQFSREFNNSGEALKFLEEMGVTP